MDARTDKRQLLAVMFTDVVGYSDKIGRDEETTVRVIREHRELVRAALAEFGGTELRTVGDAFLVVFESAFQAARCAVAIQQRHAEQNEGLAPMEQVWLRIAIHLGEVMLGADGEIYGDAVNIAARIQSSAPAGGLVVTDTVLAQIAPHGSWAFRDIGTIPLKNIVRPPRLHTLVIGHPAATRGPRRWRRTFAAVVAAAAVAGVAMVVIRLLAPQVELASQVREAQDAYDRAWTAARAGDLIAADKLFAAARERDPASWRAVLAHSFFAEDQAMVEDARERAVALAPPGSDGDLARIYDRARKELDSPAVAEAWDRWAAEHPDDELGLWLGADSYPEHGHEGLAVEEGKRHDHGYTKQYRRFVARFPDNLGARLKLAHSEYYDRHIDVAEAEIQFVLEHCTSCAYAHRMWGDIALSARRWDDAERAYRSALEIDSTIPLVRERIADLAIFRNEEDDRVRRVNAILEDDGPAANKRNFVLGHTMSLASVGRLQDAVSLLDRATDIMRGDPIGAVEMPWILVIAEIHLREPERAALDLARAIQLSLQPEMPGTLRDSIAVQALDVESQIAFLAGDRDKVEAIDARLAALPAERFVAANREDLLRNSQARLKALSGDPKSADANFRMYFPGCNPHATIARSYELAGSRESAVAVWREVVADEYCLLIPITVEGHVALGEHALREGMQQDARAHAAAARELWPRPDGDLVLTQRLVALETATAL